MKITKEWLKEKGACKEGFDWFMASKLKEPKAIDLLDNLIKNKKLDWANWLIVRVMDKKQYIAYAIYAAEQVIDIYDKKYPDDKRPRKAIEAAKEVLKNDSAENRAASYFASYFASYAAELPRVPLHAARHTTATLLLAAGVPQRVITEILGHSSAAVSAAYEHVDLALAADAMNRLSKMLTA